MTKQKPKFKNFLPIFLSTILITLLIITYQVLFSDKFFPRTFIGDSNLTFLTKAQAIQVLSAKFEKRSSQTVKFILKDQSFKLDLSTASANIKLVPTIDRAFSLGHQGSVLQKVADQLIAIFRKPTFSPEVDLSLEDQIQPIAVLVYQPSQNASLGTDLKIQPGKVGMSLDKEALINSLEKYILFGELPKDLPLKQVEPEVKTAKAEKAKSYLSLAEKDPVKLTFQDSSWILGANTLLPLLNLAQSENQLIDRSKLSGYLAKVASSVNQPFREAQFSFDPKISKVSTFQPSQEGRELDIEKTVGLIELALLNQRPKTITLPVKITEPKIQTEDVNNLGIKELIGRGISHFAGSIPNRVYNVNLTASKINGVLVPPGGIFSFNQTVGDITEATGFKKAYVIKSGRTVLDDGGGVCQDSTTLFRAVLNSGLPVVKRTAHAYRVGYYEQGFPPGLDATVFYPSVDFQFKNDTGHHILIQAYTEGTTLYVDLYGTSDGRTSTVSQPVAADQIPPPPELRQDDPTLPKGEVKQVDFPAWGANVTFSRTVKREGQTLIYETYKSNYKAWQAIYLVGTQ